MGKSSGGYVVKTLALMSDMSFLIWSYHSEIVFKDGCQELTKQGKVQRTILCTNGKGQNLVS